MLLPVFQQLRAQETAAVEADALKILNDAFAYYQSTPVQFTSKSEIIQEMGARRNEMVITQSITAAKGAVSVVGTSEKMPTPGVFFGDGVATVVFADEKSYVQVEGLESFKAAYESADLGYDAGSGANSLVGATPSTALFESLFVADAQGRGALLGSLKVDGEEVVAGTSGHRLSGVIKANPAGLPIEDASVPFTMVVAKGDAPILLSYTPDNSLLIAEFTKDKPQLGELKVTMNCSFSDWKTGADVEVEQLKLPDVAGFEKYTKFGDLIAAMQGGGGQDAGTLKGKPAPDFELATADGGTFKLSAEKGKSVVILDFWATWCGPCVKAMPIIDKVAREYAAKGVKLVAVNLRETEAEVKAFMEQHKLAPMVVMDRDGGTAEQYLVTGIPQTVIIGKDGNVAQVHVGLIPGLEEQLKSELDALVAP